MHLEQSARIAWPSRTYAAALLVVHGRIIVTAHARIDIHAGMGCVFDKDEPYSLTSEPGAIVLIVESDKLTPHARGISSPQRIAGQTWPSDGVTARKGQQQ